jgi:hypothetical protein
VLESELLRDKVFGAVVDLTAVVLLDGKALVVEMLDFTEIQESISSNMVEIDDKLTQGSFKQAGHLYKSRVRF